MSRVPGPPPPLSVRGSQLCLCCAAGPVLRGGFPCLHTHSGQIFRLPNLRGVQMALPRRRCRKTHINYIKNKVMWLTSGELENPQDIFVPVEFKIKTIFQTKRVGAPEFRCNRSDPRSVSQPGNGRGVRSQR